MSGINKVMLIGNLTRDPELRYTPQGVAVCEFALALNRSYVNKQSGEKREEVVFVDITVWGRRAEVCAEYLKKGRQTFIEGRLSQSRWEDERTGQKRSKTFVTAENVQFLGSRSNGDSVPAPAQEEAAAGASDESPEDIPF